MAESLDANELVTVEESVISSMWEIAAIVEVRERKGVLTRQDISQAINDLPAVPTSGGHHAGVANTGTGSPTAIAHSVTGLMSTYGRLITCLLVALLIGQQSCAPLEPKQAEHPKPPSEQLRQSLGVVGVYALEPLPEPSYVTPAKGGLAAAGRRAGLWAFRGMQTGGICLYAAIFCGPALAIVGAISGAISGSVADRPERSAIENAESTLTRAVVELKGESLATRLVTIMQDKNDYQGVLLTTEDLEEPLGLGTGGSITAKGVDSVLLLLVVNLGLKSVTESPDVDADLSVVVKVHAAVTQSGPIEFSHEHEIECGRSTEGRKFLEWTQGDAQLFREAVDSCYGELAENLYVWFFVA